MFTGIVEEVGRIVEIREAGEFRSLRVEAGAVVEGLAPGASIATNGVCITAREIASGSFIADLSRETLVRTTLGEAREGTRVNLERAMRADDRFGGHIVQGHVDGVGRIRSFDRDGDAWTLVVEYPPEFAPRLVWKGSIAVDGISLTVAKLAEDAFSVAIIPHTLERTNLRDREPGSTVNLEFDVLAKYVEKLVAPYLERIEGKRR